jgi:glycosyltransferase involved in cell wall biosynthesis
MIYDVSHHAAPEIGTKGLDFEIELIRALADRGHAICISENTLNDLTKFFGFPKARGSVVYPAVRSDLGRRPEGAARPVPPWTQAPPNAQYVLALSTLEPRKNLATSLKAFVAACEAAPEAALYFLIGGVDGWGEQRQLLAGVPEGLKARIRLLGYVHDPDIPGLLEGAMCLLYPSLYEGFGLPPLEAMSRGVPVISSNAGSLPEVVGQAGVMLDAHDHAGMGAVIARWARDPAECAQWAAKGREQAKKFSWEKSAAKLVAVMRENGA